MPAVEKEMERFLRGVPDEETQQLRGQDDDELLGKIRAA